MSLVSGQLNNSFTTRLVCAGCTSRSWYFVRQSVIVRQRDLHGSLLLHEVPRSIHLSAHLSVSISEGVCVAPSSLLAAVNRLSRAEMAGGGGRDRTRRGFLFSQPTAKGHRQFIRLIHF